MDPIGRITRYAHDSPFTSARLVALAQLQWEIAGLEAQLDRSRPCAPLGRIMCIPRFAQPSDSVRMSHSAARNAWPALGWRKTVHTGADSVAPIVPACTRIAECIIVLLTGS